MAETQFVIPARNLKVFSKIVQCMAKIGDDLFFDVTYDKLIMRTLNNGRSAFLSIAFSKNFFEYFSVASDGERKYQMKAKPCHAVFHNINNAEKCTIKMDEDEHKLIFDLPCKRGIKKRTQLAFEESEPLQAIYSKEQCGTRIVVTPKQLAENLPNFHSNLEEITIFVSKEGMKIKSYADSSKGTHGKKILQTELNIDATDFEEFCTEGNNVDVTFSLKEFKTIMALCEVIGQPCTIFIEKSGRPMLITLKYFNLFEADFVLATLVVSQDMPSSQTSSSSGGSSSAYSPSPMHVTPKQKPSPSPTSPLDSRSPQAPSHPSPATSGSRPNMPHSHSMGSYSQSPRALSPMAYDTTIDIDYSNDNSSAPHHRTFGQTDQGHGQDEYVSGSPQSSPQKMQKLGALNKMLGGRDLDAEDDDDDDDGDGDEHMEDDGETIPSSAS